MREGAYSRLRAYLFSSLVFSLCGGFSFNFSFHGGVSGHFGFDGGFSSGFSRNFCLGSSFFGDVGSFFSDRSGLISSVSSFNSCLCSHFSFHFHRRFSRVSSTGEKSCSGSTCKKFPHKSFPSLIYWIC